MARGKPGLLEIVEPTALPAPPKPVDNGPAVDTTDAPSLPQFGLDSLSPRLIITPEKEVPDSGIITLQMNQAFTSLTPTTLVIDQTDETDIKFSVTGGGGGNVGNLFGQAHALMVRGVGAAAAPGYFIGGTQERAHPYITYNSTTGELSFSKAGAYMLYFSGLFPTAGAGASNSILVTFTTSTSILSTGYPPNLINRVDFDSSGLAGSSVYVNESAVVFVANGTVLRPSFYPGWSGTWGNRTLIVTSLYGPGSATETQWELTKQYAYQYVDYFGDGTGMYQWVGFEGAPYGTNGAVPAHQFSSLDPYPGDAATPIWYPDGPMYMTFNISPFPNLLPGDITATVASFEGSIPNDIEIGINRFNVGSGIAEQGIWLRLPHKDGSYSGTSFKILFTAEGIVTNHPIFFKMCQDGQNGCVTTGPYTLVPQLYASQANGLAPQYPVYLDQSYYWYENDGMTRLVADTDAQNSAAMHVTFQQGTIWKNPQSLTTQLTFVGLVQKGIGGGYTILETYQYHTILEPASPPIIDWRDETTTNLTDWVLTPVGHWRIRYAINQDYWQTDPDWQGGAAPLEIPALYKLEWFDGATIVAEMYFAMGSAV